MRAAAALARAIERLSAASVAEPQADARILLRHVVGIDALALAAGDAPDLDKAQLDAFDAAIARRAAGEPVGRILGERAFFGLPFRLSPETLEPRHDSETAVIEGLKSISARYAPCILDLGVGSGALLLAILYERPDATGIGLDVSGGALATALANARALGVSDRMMVVRGDWTSAVRGPFDLVISNPPYIASEEIPRLDREVRLFDPLRALDGGADGLTAYRRIIPDFPRLLKPGGCAVLEIGHNQAASVEGLCRFTGAQQVTLVKDLGGRPRVVVATFDES